MNVSTATLLEGLVNGIQLHTQGVQMKTVFHCKEASEVLDEIHAICRRAIDELGVAVVHGPREGLSANIAR